MILACSLRSAILNVVNTKCHSFKVILGLKYHWWPTFGAQFKRYLSRLELIFSTKPKPFLTSSSSCNPWNSVARVISTHVEAKELSGAMRQGRTELFLHLASPRATSQETQLLGGPPKSKSHFQRHPSCAYIYTWILFPSRGLSSWIRPLVVLVSALCCACVNLCAWHMCMCGVGFVYLCAWWENMFSLTPGETWNHRALLDYYTLQCPHDRHSDISASEKWHYTSNSKILQ